MCRALVLEHLGDGQYRVQRAPAVDYAQVQIVVLQNQVSQMQSTIAALLLNRSSAQQAMDASGTTLDSAIQVYSDAVRANVEARATLEYLRTEIEDQEKSVADLQEEFDEAQEVYDQAQAALDEAIIRFNNGEITEEELSVFQIARDMAYSEYLNASGRLGAASQHLDELKAQRDATTITDINPLYAAMERAATDYQTKQLDYGKADALYQSANLRITALDKRLASVQQSKQSMETEFEAWCADLSEDLSGYVGTCEINGESDHVIVRPGYSDDAAFNNSRDGSLAPVKLQTPAQAAFNWTVKPGWQKWKPTYRVGLLLSVNADLGAVRLDPAVSSIQDIDINETEELTDVQIEYMSCNGAAFEENDRVLVEFRQEGSERVPYVIGFETDPKPCEIGVWCMAHAFDQYGVVQDAGFFLLDWTLNTIQTHVPARTNYNPSYVFRPPQSFAAYGPDKTFWLQEDGTSLVNDLYRSKAWYRSYYGEDEPVYENCEAEYDGEGLTQKIVGYSRVLLHGPDWTVPINVMTTFRDGHALTEQYFTTMAASEKRLFVAKRIMGSLEFYFDEPNLLCRLWYGATSYTSIDVYDHSGQLLGTVNTNVESSVGPSWMVVVDDRLVISWRTYSADESETHRTTKCYSLDMQELWLNVEFDENAAVSLAGSATKDICVLLPPFGDMVNGIVLNTETGEYAGRMYDLDAEWPPPYGYSYEFYSRLALTKKYVYFQTKERITDKYMTFAFRREGNDLRDWFFKDLMSILYPYFTFPYGRSLSYVLAPTLFIV